ncbi:hypothetical protein PPM_1619 [Paenibacillus polymyxa M1]|nr:hypothetical protein PPM_1619 [Paenibacillus polymyxa M1]
MTTIQQFLGHGHVAMTNIYTLTTQQDMAEAMANTNIE